MAKEGAAVQAVLGLGSNLGDREGCLRSARERLRQAGGVELESASPVYESPPLAVSSSQGPYLNQVVVVSTRLAPGQLFNLGQAIEAQLGRPRDHTHGTPRTIDIDLITYGSLVLGSPDLTLPHPRYTGRKFVLLPLQNVLPSFTDPVTGRTIQALIETCPDPSVIKLWRSLEEASC